MKGREGYWCFGFTFCSKAIFAISVTNWKGNSENPVIVSELGKKISNRNIATY